LRSFIHSWKPMLLSLFLWPLYMTFYPSYTEALEKENTRQWYLALKLSFYACVCQTSPMCEVQCRRLLHQEGRALQSLEIRFFVLFWRRIIDFKKDETKKSLLCFRFWCASVYDDESFGFCLSISLACSLSYRILVLTVIWSYFISRYIFILIAAWILLPSCSSIQL